MRQSGEGLVGSTVSTTRPCCHVAYGWLTQVRGLGTYTIPKIDTQVSAVFQSKPGQLLAANYAMPVSASRRLLETKPRRFGKSPAMCKLSGGVDGTRSSGPETGPW